MGSGDAEAFSDVLRRYRVAAGLSQEALAERAGLSARAISDLERGIRRAPYRDTVRLLADALGLADTDRGRLEASVRRTRTPARAEATEATAPPRPPHNLPAPLTSFVGRTDEVATVRRLLADYRLVTLTGPGGIGKTRLAVETARTVLDQFPDGVRLVELAALTEAGLVAQAVAEVLDVREQAGRPMTASLAEYVRDRTMLLVLDNCEHLLAAAAALAEALLVASPHLRVLATSRQALGQIGEAIYRVLPLLLPDKESGRGVTALSSVEAVQLFLERAAPAAMDFALTERNAGAVAQICTLLDGIPLAIELAAARVKVLTPEQIAARLDDRFALLTGGSRAALPRQQTLRALIDWSYDLLSHDEQWLLARLAVFRGGFTLEAVEAVAGGRAPPPGPPVVDLLTALVDKSLILVDRRDEAMRYHLLETVREYAMARLSDADRVDAERRLVHWCAAFAQQMDAALRGPGQQEALDRFEREHGNVRAALEWSQRDPETAAVGLHLAAASRHFWMIRGHSGEGRVWLESLLAAAADAPATLRAQALDGAAALAQSQGDGVAARGLQEQALRLWRRLEQPLGLGVSLNTLGIMLKSEGDLTGASAVFEEALANLRAAGHVWAQSTVLNNLAAVASDLGEYERAVSYSEASIALKRELGDVMGVAVSLFNMAEAARKLGDVERSTALFDEAAAIFRQAGNSAGLAQTLQSLGLARIRQGNLDGAQAALRESLARYREIDNRPGVILCVESLAELATAVGEWRQAARLLGAAAAARSALSAPPAPSDQEELDRTLARIRAAMPAPVFEAAWAAGSALPLDAAATLALEQLVNA
jgi:predicted ATPase/transcriptional regulator with XRE-family HTH domain/Tfp pilus assembly protein PilF